MRTRYVLLALLSTAGLACGRVALDPVDPVDALTGFAGASGAGGERSGGGGLSGGGGHQGTGGRGAGGSGVGGRGAGGNVGIGGSTGFNCDGLDEMLCLAAGPACRADYCPTCGAATRFVRCAFPNGPRTTCIAPPCVPPLPCAAIRSLADCESRGDCHSVFAPVPPMCPCPGCCPTFIACADGDRATCWPAISPLCKTVAPICDGGYRVSVSNGCYEGCVAIKDCEPVPSPPPLPPPPPPPPPPP